ncbi:MAG: HAD-IA family hydrolase, partial [Candidatus Roizmanbacteria bacterium]|nr:HAD-IA family hydrolase [Candidatus Roizmanbacteria bacterium]
IEKVKKRTKIGLLTNMYVHMLDRIQEKGILPQVKWDTIMDSSIVRLQKPDKALFELAEKEARVSKEEILFIDNQEKHVLAARQCGWQAYVYDSADYIKSSKQLEDFFNHVGVL